MLVFVSLGAGSPLLDVLHKGLYVLYLTFDVFGILGWEFLREVGEVRFLGEVGGLATFSRCPLP